MGIHVFAMARRSCNVAFKLKAVAAAEGGSKQAAAHPFQIVAKRVTVVFGSQDQLLTDIRCPNCLVDVVAPDNAGERERH